MNGNKWSNAQWCAYETAKVLVPVILLESLILAAEAHSLNIRVTSNQKQRWNDKAKEAMNLVDEVVKKVEVI